MRNGLFLLFWVVSCLACAGGATAVEFGLNISGRGVQQTSVPSRKMGGYEAEVFGGLFSWLNLSAIYSVDQYKIVYLDRTDECSETFSGVGFIVKPFAYLYVKGFGGQVHKHLAVAQERDTRIGAAVGSLIPIHALGGKLAAMSVKVELAVAEDHPSRSVVNIGMIGLSALLFSRW